MQQTPTKQPGTEETIEHTGGEQNTGNHHRPGAPDAGGPDRVGGTRAGAENVEGARTTTGEGFEALEEDNDRAADPKGGP